MVSLGGSLAELPDAARGYRYVSGFIYNEKVVCTIADIIQALGPRPYDISKVLTIALVDYERVFGLLQSVENLFAILCTLADLPQRKLLLP